MKFEHFIIMLALFLLFSVFRTDGVSQFTDQISGTPVPSDAGVE